MNKPQSFLLASISAFSISCAANRKEADFTKNPAYTISASTPQADPVDALDSLLKPPIPKNKIEFNAAFKNCQNSVEIIVSFRDKIRGNLAEDDFTINLLSCPQIRTLTRLIALSSLSCAEVTQPSIPSLNFDPDISEKSEMAQSLVKDLDKSIVEIAKARKECIIQEKEGL